MRYHPFNVKVKQAEFTGIQVHTYTDKHTPQGILTERPA